MIEAPPHSSGISLAVDDSRVTRKAARRMLKALGLAVAEAEDGAEAMSAAVPHCHGRRCKIGTYRGD